jgi:terminase small subunit-like protein
MSGRLRLRSGRNQCCIRGIAALARRTARGDVAYQSSGAGGLCGAGDLVADPARRLESCVTKTAAVSGSRLLKLANVQDAIAELTAKARNAVNTKLASQPRVLDSLGLDVRGLTPERVLEELIYLGMGDIGELFDERGNLRPLREMAPHARRMIASLDVVTAKPKGNYKLDEIRKLRLWSKVEAIDKLAQHLGLLRQVDFTLTVQRAERMSDAEIVQQLDEMRQQFARWAIERQSLPAPPRSSSSARG